MPERPVPFAGPSLLLQMRKAQGRLRFMQPIEKCQDDVAECKPNKIAN
jgi:hypothetical protein